MDEKPPRRVGDVVTPLRDFPAANKGRNYVITHVIKKHPGYYRYLISDTEGKEVGFDSGWALRWHEWDVVSRDPFEDQEYDDIFV